MDKNFIYGIAKVTFASTVLGYIEKGSWDWGGQKPEMTDIEAEQVPDAPVLSLPSKNGTIKPTFNLIQLDYANLKTALGGTLVGGEEKPTGWKAPESVPVLKGQCEIEFVSGKTLTIPNASLTANLGGKLSLSEVSKIECQLSVNKPEGGGSAYEINDTAAAAAAGA